MTPAEIQAAVEVARSCLQLDGHEQFGEGRVSTDLARALVALAERCGKYEQALKTIANGAPMPESWGEQPRGIDAYHVAIAKATLTRKPAP